MNNDRKAVYQRLGMSLADGLKMELEIGRETIASGETYMGAKEFADGKGRSGAFDNE